MANKKRTLALSPGCDSYRFQRCIALPTFIIWKVENVGGVSQIVRARTEYARPGEASTKGRSAAKRCGGEQGGPRASSAQLRTNLMGDARSRTLSASARRRQSAPGQVPTPVPL